MIDFTKEHYIVSNGKHPQLPKHSIYNIIGDDGMVNEVDIIFNYIDNEVFFTITLDNNDFQFSTNEKDENYWGKYFMTKSEYLKILNRNNKIDELLKLSS